MDKETIKTVIKESQERKLPMVIPREIDIPLNSSKIVAITGPRRSGKTYLFYFLIKQLLKKGFSPEQILYINFDDPRLLPMDSIGIEMILESFEELYPNYETKENYIFFDEIQNVKDWEIGIRRIYDTMKFKMFITGSSSKFLGKEIATQLRGRAINYEILPFSFKEMLRAKKIIPGRNVIYSQKRFQIINLLNEYIDMGGFPEVILEESNDIKLRTLKEYVETMFFKDLVERYNVKNQIILRELMKYLATNISNIFSVNSFYKWIRKTYAVSRQTLIKYISFLEDSGVFFFIKKFSFSQKGQSWFLRKSYIVDNGLRKVYGFRFSDDKGRSLENIVFIELKHRQTMDPLMELFYFRDYEQHEVDFVVMHGREVKFLIQACVDIENYKVKQREIAGLIRASEELRCNDLLVVTLEYEGIETVKDKKIFFKPLWKWLVEKSV